MSWTHEQPEQLIDCYKMHECLYVVKHRDYHNKHRRSLALHMIVEGLKTLRPNTTELEVQKKFQGLRTTYAAERRKQIESMHSGMGESEVYRPGLWYFVNMEFLNDHLNIRPSKSSFTLPEEIEGNEQPGQESEVPEAEVFHELQYEHLEEESMNAMQSSAEPSQTCTPSSTPPHQPKKKRKMSDTNLNPEISLLKDVSTSLNNMAGALCEQTRSDSKTAEDTFGEFVASQLKKIKDDEIKEETQFQIHSVLYKAFLKEKELRKNSE